MVAGGAALYYYFTQSHNVGIEKLLNKPAAYTGKVVYIEGEVIDRTSFFNAIKFYKVRDKSGEIIVVTKSRTLPGLNSIATVKGNIEDSFPIGDQKITVFVEESVEEKRQ